MTGFLKAYLRRQGQFDIDKRSKLQNLLSVKISDRTWEFKKREGHEVRINYIFKKYVLKINNVKLSAEFQPWLR